MNLYFRLILIFIKTVFARRINLLEGSRSYYRVWPFDCDINLHLTNPRYFSLCDLSRITYMGQVGILFKMVKRNWLPIVQAQEISYLKPIKPFQRFEVFTRFTYWDDKYWYIEHKFFTEDRLCAVLQVRGVFVHGKRIVPIPEVLNLVGEDVKPPNKTEAVTQWIKLLESKKIQ
jgi:acyl-CoA thioesterase FadM